MKPGKVQGLDPLAPLRPNAVRIVETRLDELCSLAPPALGPGASQAQHDLRIAAKRLRYVLDIVAPCVGVEAEAIRDVARDLQGVLGDLHDCDVMLPLAAGIDSLEAILRARREQHYDRFLELWQEKSHDLHRGFSAPSQGAAPRAES